MEAHTFHLFPRLPLELQRLIWQAALQPRCHGPDAAQCFGTICDIQLTKDNPKRPSISDGRWPQEIRTCVITIPKSDLNGKDNQATYKWDKGLWSACRESRHVISRSVAKQCWLQEEFGWPYNYLPRSYIGRPVPVMCPPPDVTNHGVQTLVVHPNRDAFKIDLKQLQDLVFGHDSFSWMHISRDILKSMSLKACEDQGNLVLEFDSTWSRNWPRPSEVFSRELSPQSFVYALLIAKPRAEAQFVIWLIDKGEYKFGPETGSLWKPKGTHPKVFYYGDKQYVEVEFKHHQDDHESAMWFIEKLSTMYRSYFGMSHIASEAKPRVRVLRPKNLM